MNVLRFYKLASKGIEYSRVHVDRLERAGKFPKRIHLGENAVAWVESEIDQWLEAKAAERGVKSEAQSH